MNARRIVVVDENRKSTAIADGPTPDMRTNHGPNASAVLPTSKAAKAKRWGVGIGERLGPQTVWGKPFPQAHP